MLTGVGFACCLSLLSAYCLADWLKFSLPPSLSMAQGNFLLGHVIGVLGRNRIPLSNHRPNWLINVQAVIGPNTPIAQTS